MKPSTIKLAKKLGKIYRQDSRSVWVDVPSKDILKVLQEVRKETERISDLSVYDTGKNMLEVMYRFIVGQSDVLTLKTRTAAEKPKLPTCTGLFPGALLIEREQHEMFGIIFEGHPNLERVLYADTTPETPLRKKVKK